MGSTVKLSQVLLSIATVLTLAGDPARAGLTSPTLLLTAASGALADGARSVTVDGLFDFPNAIQVGYPLHLVIFQGDRFVRFPAVGAPATGNSALVADGSLTEGEVAGLLGEGAAATAGVRIVTMVVDRLRVTLPSTFTAGPATAILFTILSDGTVLSNAIAFTLP